MDSSVFGQDLPPGPWPEVSRTVTGELIFALPGSPDPHYLHSRLDPIAEARGVAENAALEQAGVVMVFGVGAGHLLRATAAATPAATAIYCVVLDPGCLLCAHRQGALDDLLGDSRIIFLAGDLAAIVRRLPRAAEEDLRVVVHPPLLAATAPTLAPLAAMARELEMVQRSRLRQRVQVLANIEQNLPLILRSEPAAALASALANRRLLLIGPGPSLEGQLGQLARAASRGVPITALDTALRPLLEAGIPVDLLFTLHPLEENLAKVEGLAIDCPVVYFEAAHPQIAAAGPRPLFACEAGGLLDRAHPLFGAHGRYSSEGTVLIAALEVLAAIPAARIGLCGIDLALAGEARYAGGRAAAPGARVEVPARDGGTTLTTPSLALHRTRLERWLARTPRRVVDLTAAGAAVAGLPRRTLDAWLADRAPEPAVDLRSGISARILGDDPRAEQALIAARSALEVATRPASESR